MKKLLNLSAGYLAAGIACGVFYREYTKYTAFTGKTTLAFTHLHLLVLGAFLYLILTLFAIQTELLAERRFKHFLVVYNIGLPFMVIMLFVRGITQVQGVQLSKGADAAISGITGIAHIIVTAAFVLLFISLKSAVGKFKKD